MRVLVTGANGFVGRHLVDLLAKNQKLEIFCVVRSKRVSDFAAYKKNRLKVYACDIRNKTKIRSVLKIVRPERIFHLAGQASVADSWRSPYDTLETNIWGAHNVLEAVRDIGIRPRIQVAGSAEEYGVPLKSAIPIKEKQPLSPITPYGVSKSVQDFLAMQYYQCFGIWVVRTRAFNQIGAGQKNIFAASNFAKQVALIEAGREKPVIRVGNLSAIRDFTDVRDAVHAYWLSLEKGKPGEAYNICTGKGIAIRDVLHFYLKQSGQRIRVLKDPSRLRPASIPVLVGCPSKFMKQTGWKPQIPIEKTLLDLLNDWRGRVNFRKV